MRTIEQQKRYLYIARAYVGYEVTLAIHSCYASRTDKEMMLRIINATYNRDAWRRFCKADTMVRDLLMDIIEEVYFRRYQMILLHNSMELHENKARIPSSVYEFLVRQFALLEDEDPQMNVYGDMDFCCTTGTIGIIYSEDELEELKILDEMMLSDDVKIFTCMDGALPLDVVLIEI